MEHLPKPPIIKSALIWKILLVCVLGGIGIVLEVFGYIEFDRYRSVSDLGVPVTAVIYDVDEYYDSDDGTQYDIYVKYTYEAKTYYEHYETSSSSRSLRRIGEEVTIVINPHDPTERISGIITHACSMFAFGTILICIAIACLGIRHFGDYIETYGMRSSAILSELKAVATCRFGWLAWTTGALLLISFVVYAWEEVRPLTFGIPACVFVVIGTKKSIEYLKNLHSLATGEYRREDEYVTRMDTYTDSDGDSNYRVFLHAQSGDEKHIVSEKRYNSVKLNSRVIKISCGSIAIRYTEPSFGSGYRRF